MRKQNEDQCVRIDELQENGDACFIARQYEEVQSYYADTLTPAKEDSIRPALLSNLAAIPIEVISFNSALIDCNGRYSTGFY